MATQTKLSVTEGNLVPGVRIDDHTFAAGVKTAQLFQFAPDPRKTEDEKERARNVAMADLWQIRREVQRMFHGAKAANVDKYSGYLRALAKGDHGFVPPIILWTSQPLKTSTDDGLPTGEILIPFGAWLIAIDGETQLAARYKAVEDDPSFGQTVAPIFIVHHRDEQWARQASHDLNLLAVRPDAALGLAMERGDAVTNITRVVEEAVSLFNGRVNKIARQLPKKVTPDGDVLTIVSLRGAVTTLARGITGVKFGAKPVEMSPQEAEKVQHAAVSWFGALADAFRAEFQDRSKSIIAAPAVMSALGALGNDLVDLSPAQRQQRQLELIAELRHIDWAPGQHWAGIAGKLTASGKFTVGGAKETAYAIYNETYRQIRRRRAAGEDTLRKPLKRTMKAEGLTLAEAVARLVEKGATRQ